MTNTVISFPTPAYSNLPIEPQFFAPWRFVITAISFGVTTTLTLLIPSITELNYNIGQQVRLIIPPTSGSRQLNNQSGYILSIPTTDSIVIDIDSNNADVFVYNANAEQQAQCLSIGDINNGFNNQLSPNNTITFIPGSFINISPT